MAAAKIVQDEQKGGRAPNDGGFSVSISATGRDQNDPSRFVHAVSVTQPVQCWIVLREYKDFVDVGKELSSVIPGIPPCPINCGGTGSAALTAARNSLQDWLCTLLRFPGVRESPSIRLFLCNEANVLPVRFQGIIDWFGFECDSSGSANSSRAVSGNGRNQSLDEMEMDDMFDTGGGFDGADEEDEEDDEAVAYAVRYPPAQEELTTEDRMEFHEEVEMVEDVGSLAQSLGASHLGRSLQLQAEIAHVKQQKDSRTTKVVPSGEQQGVTVGGASGEKANGSSGGGIGGIVEGAQFGQQPPSNPLAKISGLGNSFRQHTPVSPPRLDSFTLIKVIGKGSFGKVFLVREKQTSEMFALKVLRKDNIIKRNQVEHTRTERSVLGYVKHPFIVGMNMAFQSKDKLYFVLDYCAGGELFFHLGKVGKFPEPRASFYAAEIILAISYVHELDIIYRDLKPENVLLDAVGHIRLTDFGLSKEGISGSSSGANSFCGTPEYLAPEILNRLGHGRAVDWWSLGALLYEMLTGLPPFYCRDREKLFEKIRKCELGYPRHLSVPAQGLLRGLLMKDPTKRLGSGPLDAKDIQAHDFFVDLDWDKLARGDVPPPWNPQLSSSLDTSQFDDEFTRMPMFSPESLKPHGGFGRTAQDNVFEGFTFTDRTLHRPNMGI